jgi:hypothetical protein
MKPHLLPSVAVGLALLVLTPNRSGLAPGHSPSPDTPWTPGLYTGWVYFEAKTDWSFHGSLGPASADGAGVKFYVSHGDIECSVDGAGTGNCAATFPMDIVWSVSATVKTPECTENYRASARADGMSSPPPLHPLLSQPMETGFSLGFQPDTGPASGNSQASGCKSMSASFNMQPGMPKWPDLDFGLDFHTSLSIGGTCSMKGLPRSTSAGMTIATLSLTSCQWQALYLDPYAKLP